MTLALDGSIDGDGSSALTLTTSHANDIIVFIAVTNGPSGDPVVSLSDTAGLTWARRALLISSFPGAYAIYWAKAPSALSGDIISFTLDPATNFSAVYAFGVSGANTSSPWDPNAGLPVIEPDSEVPDGGNGTITTSNANDFLIGVYGSGLDAPLPGAGWTAIGSQAFVLVECKVVSSVQNNATVPATVGGGINFMADAIVAAAQGSSVQCQLSGPDTVDSFGIGPPIASLSYNWFPLHKRTS